MIPLHSTRSNETEGPSVDKTVHRDSKEAFLHAKFLVDFGWVLLLRSQV
jgi:hypothetical protein